MPLEPHTPVEIPGKAATCTTVGLSRGYSCSVCNTLVTAQKETPKIPHSFNGNKCTVCGYVRNVNSSDTAETGLTLKGLINKDISILKYFNLYTGSSVHLGFKDTSISGAKIYVTESDVLGYPCTIYLFTSPDSSLIYSIHCYAKMSTYNRANLLSAETATKYTNETMKALNTIFNTINNNFNATVESVEDIHGIFAPTPTVNKLQYSDIYDKIYKRYPTGFVCESGIIQIKGKLSAGKYSNCEYRVYIAEYSTDGGWYIHGNCIVVEF